ncbi:MAG TPA: HEAT repeat domain-containing protein [Gemmatimonadaceae bacterium]|nr:HEAT repeat domain-containing protein [Gemmatimonadaceae bacterium]
MTMELIGWALVHSLWQGVLIAVVMAGIFAMTRQASSSLRYLLGLTALGLMLALPVATAFRMNVESAAVPDAATSGTSSVTGISGDVTTDGPVASVEETSSSSVSASGSQSNTADSNSGTASAGAVALPNASNPLAPSVAKLRGIANKYVPLTIPWLVAAWIIGLLVLSARLIGGVTRTRRLTRDASTNADDRVILAVRQLSEKLGVRKLIVVLQSTKVEVPLVVGALRPVIVVPVSLITGMTPWQLEMLLAHEIAHIKRYDYLANLAQTVIETLMFYHPAVRWLSERVRDERENCCDDIAVATCGGDPAAYTETLLALEHSRSEGLVFAAAATGGSLLKRAQRLLVREPAHSEIGPRWIAGLITILAALFTASQSVEATVRASFIPNIGGIQVGFSDSDTTTKSRDGWPDPSRAAPTRVLRAPAGGSLAERWKWADDQSRSLGSDTYWIGYLIAGSSNPRHRYYFDDQIPVRIGTSTFSGRMHLGDGDLSEFRFAGVPLAPLVGNHAVTSTAIFMQFHRRDPSRVQHIHLGAFSLPVYFNRAPVIWLDSASDAESLERVRSLMSRASSEDARSDLVATTGAHQDARIVVPMLIGWIESRTETDDLRKEAVEWLAKKPGDPRSVATLARTARRDRSGDVRREAIEAFSHMEIANASDTLIALAESLTEREDRQTAIEALGHHEDPKALMYLTRIARGSASDELRKEAVEAMANMPDGRGFTSVADIARTEASSEVRQKAVEELGNTKPERRAIEALREIIRTDPDGSVRVQATETLAEIHDPRIVEILRELATQSSDLRVQVEATESLGDTYMPRQALEALIALAKTHRSFDVRRKALETLGDFHEERGAVDALIGIARSREMMELRLAAVEALGDTQGGRGLAELSALARGKESLELRRKAIETYAENAKPESAITFLRAIIANDSDEEIRMYALEALAELDDTTAWRTITEIARSGRDPVLRERAGELLRDR